MIIPDDKKIDLLSAQLQERYEALHRMRDRSMQFVLWILGLGLGLAWLSISELVFTFVQKLAITVLLGVIGIVAIAFVHAIARGFRANREVMIRIEGALCLYDPDCYGTVGPILPSRFSSLKTGWTGHFAMLYILIGVIILLLLVLTWTNPCSSAPRGSGTSPNQTEHKVQVLVKEVKSWPTVTTYLGDSYLELACLPNRETTCRPGGMR